MMKQIICQWFRDGNTHTNEIFIDCVRAKETHFRCDAKATFGCETCLALFINATKKCGCQSMCSVKIQCQKQIARYLNEIN